MKWEPRNVYIINYCFHIVYLDIEASLEKKIFKSGLLFIILRSYYQSKNSVVQIPDLTQLNIVKSALSMFHHEATYYMINESIPTRHCHSDETLWFRLAEIHKSLITKQVLRATIYTVYIAGVPLPLLLPSPSRIYNLLVHIIIYAHQFKAAVTDHSNNEYVRRNVWPWIF